MRDSGTAAYADNRTVERPTVECLRCGHARAFSPSPRRRDEAGDCPRCGYVGWAYSTELNERTRRLVRELPLERRLRIRPV